MKKIMRPLDIKSVKAHRLESCIHYEGCLNEASALQWPSFSCQGCNYFIPKKRGTHPLHHLKACTPLAWEI